MKGRMLQSLWRLQVLFLLLHIWVNKQISAADFLAQVLWCPGLLHIPICERQ